MTKVVSSPYSRYSKADAFTKQRIIGASIGEPGTGKTSFWLSAPGPILIQSFDKGLEGVVERFVKDGKEIYFKDYEWVPTVDLSQEDAVVLRDQFTEDFEHAIQHFRTVVWDKETDVWELFRYAEFGAPNDSPRNYPQLNQRYRRLVNMPKATDVNFGLIQGMKDEWVSKINKKTGAQGAGSSGNRIRAGFSEIEGLVHINLEHTRKNGTFSLNVGKARGPGCMDIQDQSFENLTFTEFACLAFPDSTEEDWQ